MHARGSQVAPWAKAFQACAPSASARCPRSSWHPACRLWSTECSLNFFKCSVAIGASYDQMILQAIRDPSKTLQYPERKKKGT